MSMQAAIDLHLHILPDLDDGARSMEQSLRMARLAVQGGVDTIVVTPHANQPGRFENFVSPRLGTVLEAFQRELLYRQIALRVIPGMEIFATVDLVERIDQGLLCPLGKSNCFLVELPVECTEDYADRIWQRMLVRGYRPVIAHPERYDCVKRNPALAQQWRRNGCVLQLNGGSLYGQFGELCRQTAVQLVDEGWFDVFGSDAHDPDCRVPGMEPARSYLTERFGAQYAHHVLRERPAGLLNLE